MEEDWVLIYQTDQEYKASVVQQLLEEEGLHPVVLDRKDDEFLIGDVELYISPLEADQARKVIAENEEIDGE